MKKKILAGMMLVFACVSQVNAQIIKSNGFCEPGTSILPVQTITEGQIVPTAWIFLRNIGPIPRFAYLNIRLQVDQLCGSGWVDEGVDRDCPGVLLFPYLKEIVETDDELFELPWGADFVSLWRFKVEVRLMDVAGEGYSVLKTFYSSKAFHWCDEPEGV